MSYRYNRHGPDGKFIKAAPAVVCPHEMYLGFDGPATFCEHGVRVRAGRVTVTEMPSEIESDNREGNNASVPIPLWVLLGAAGGWCLAELVNLACSR